MITLFMTLLQLWEVQGDAHAQMSTIPYQWERQTASLERLKGLPKTSVREIEIYLPNENPPDITARSALVVDDETEFILYEYQADKVVPLASITKLATVLTAIELGADPKKTIIITEEDIIEDASALEIGDQLTVNDLYGLALIGSSNSSAHTIARAIGLEMSTFVEHMNRVTKELGLTHSHFVEPTGLDPKNIGTARDAYRLLKAIEKHPVGKTHLNKSEYIFNNGQRNKKVFATNIFKIGILKFTGNEILASKTGHIPEAGYHFTMTATDQRDKKRKVIILGARDHFKRFTEAQELLLWAQEQNNDQ